MGFFDSVKDIAGAVGNSVSKGAKSVSENTKKLAEKSKLNKEITNTEKEINTSFAEIGKKYFETIKDSPSEEYAADVENIISKTAELEELKKSLEQLEDKHLCPNCGASVLKTQVFCDKCGAKLEHPAEEEADTSEVVEAEVVGVDSIEKKTCPHCGNTVEPDQRFCKECGTEIK